MNTYEVIVSNVGTVHTGTNKREALLCYRTYVDRVQGTHGRCAGEDVTLMENDEPIIEYTRNVDGE